MLTFARDVRLDFEFTSLIVRRSTTRSSNSEGVSKLEIKFRGITVPAFLCLSNGIATSQQNCYRQAALFLRNMIDLPSDNPNNQSDQAAAPTPAQQYKKKNNIEQEQKPFIDTRTL